MPDDLVDGLFKCGCFLVGEFRLSSGKISPYYIDLRKVPSNPKLFDSVTDIYVSTIRGLGNFDRIAGIATAGLPIATLVAYKLGKPLVYVRRERKEHGTIGEVEGGLRPGERVVVVDDVATTGESIKLAVQAIRDRGGVVDHSVVLIDRGQGAGSLLAGIGVKLVAATTARSLLEQLRLKGLMSEEEYERVVRYMEGEHV